MKTGHFISRFDTPAYCREATNRSTVRRMKRRTSGVRFSEERSNTISAWCSVMTAGHSGCCEMPGRLRRSSTEALSRWSEASRAALSLSTVTEPEVHRESKRLAAQRGRGPGAADGDSHITDTHAFNHDASPRSAPRIGVQFARREAPRTQREGAPVPLGDTH